MIGAMTLIDKVNFIKPPGPGPDPGDDAALAQFTASVRALSPNGQRSAWAFLVADPAETGLSGAARADYFRYLAVAGALGAVLGAAAMFVVKRK